MRVGDQEALFKTDSVSHMPPVQSGEMFSARKEKQKRTLNFSYFILAGLSVPLQLL